MLLPVSPTPYGGQTSFCVDFSPAVSRCVNVSIGLTSFFLLALGLHFPCFLSPQKSPHRVLLFLAFEALIFPFLQSLLTITGLGAQADAILFLFQLPCPPNKWLTRAPESQPPGEPALVTTAELPTLGTDFH